MFCDGCGGALQPEQQFCARCGRQVVGQGTVAYPAASRVREHVRLLGILWMAMSAVNVLGGVVLGIVANTLLARSPDFTIPNFHAGFLPPMLTAVAGFILTKGLVEFLAGWGLLTHQTWARLLTLVLAFLALFHIPFGTALGIYSLWVLLPSESEREYEAMALQPAA